jgi:hypothetical protein
MPFEFRIAVEADEPGRTVSVTVERLKETISPKLGLIESRPLKVVLTVGGLIGEEEWTWLYAHEARKVAEALNRAADVVQADRG